MFSNLFSGGKSYAIGTSNAPEGVHTVNEKGWELIDTPKGKTAIGLGKNAIGETAYLPQGTKVRTNLSSTELMVQEIKKEVSSQLSRIDFNVNTNLKDQFNLRDLYNNSNNNNANAITTPQASNITIVINSNANNNIETARQMKRTLQGMGFGL